MRIWTADVSSVHVRSTDAEADRRSDSDRCTARRIAGHRRHAASQDAGASASQEDRDDVAGADEGGRATGEDRVVEQLRFVSEAAREG
jgi:hypothetical protein